MMERAAPVKRLQSYPDAPAEIEHVLERLSQSNSRFVSNEDIGAVWERVSKALDITFSDDENDDAWAL